jgi:hypothetical protein
MARGERLPRDGRPCRNTAAPFNDAAATRGDKNPYIQVGDAIVLGPTLLLDVRYGLARVKTENLHGNKEGFIDYASFGA